ncbi:hypothetical protein GZ212_06675 [Mangrovimonas sp. CR14]|uniref:hypothetical protein n=1 Tax=Mangrovimonas sp. CR14 TaxID=2706120 RepID=UPI00141ECCE0|nr:hypothetical protein [Mangrovimonas sp. CR14]NIK91830.1 hypothetical protein [Mangrovimonas sp. CR14]
MEDKKYKLFLNALNWSALVIILLSLTSLVVIIFYLTFSDNSPVINNVDVIYSSSQNDSIQKITFESYEKILEKKISDVNEVETIIEKKISEVNSFYKFIGTILAIIIAVTGFFGFKSLQELKRSTLEKVKEVSENIAVKEIDKEKQNLKDITNKTISEAALEQKLKLISDFHDYEIKLNTLNSDLDEVKSRDSKIEELDKEISDLKRKVNLLFDAATKVERSEEQEIPVKEDMDKDINLGDLEDNDEFDNN